MDSPKNSEASSPTQTAPLELEIKPSAGQKASALGVMVVAAAITGLLMLLFVGGGADLLARRTTITTYLPDATGVAEESVVRLGGIPIGKVNKFGLSGRLDRQNAVKVEMRVVTRYLKSIPEDSITNISADTLVGYPFIDINPGKSRVALRENAFLRSEPVEQADVRADQLRAISNTFRQIDDLLAVVDSKQTQIGRLVNSSDIYDSLIAQVGGFDRGMHAFITPQNAVGQAFYSSVAYDDIRKTVLNVDSVLSAIQAGDGVAGQWFANDQTYDDAVRMLKDLHSALADLNAGKGAFGQLLQDDRSYETIRTKMVQVDAMVASASGAEMLHSPQQYEALNGALRELDALLRDVREKPKKYLRYKP